MGRKRIYEKSEGAERARAYYWKHRDEKLAYCRAYRVRNGQRALALRKQLKKELFTHYSKGTPRCAHCGITELDVLVLDHINGDAWKERAEFKIPHNTGIYSWLRRNNYPEGYQILCSNCNLRKKIRVDDFRTAVEKNQDSIALRDRQMGLNLDLFPKQDVPSRRVRYVRNGGELFYIDGKDGSMVDLQSQGGDMRRGSDECRSVVLSVRVSRHDGRIIKEKAANLGMTVNEFLSGIIKIAVEKEWGIEKGSS